MHGAYQLSYPHPPPSPAPVNIPLHSDYSRQNLHEFVKESHLFLAINPASVYYDHKPSINHCLSMLHAKLSLPYI